MEPWKNLAALLDITATTAKLMFPSSHSRSHFASFFDQNL